MSLSDNTFKRLRIHTHTDRKTDTHTQTPTMRILIENFNSSNDNMLDQRNTFLSYGLMKSQEALENLEV